MNNYRWTWSLLLAGGLLAASLPAQEIEKSSREVAAPPMTHFRSGVPLIGQDVEVGTNVIAEELVLIGGTAKVDGVVERDMVVINGDTQVNGTVRGDVVVVLGETRLGPNTDIRGNLVAVAGAIKIDPQARIRGDRVVIPLGIRLPHLTWVSDWLSVGLLWARPLPHQYTWVWGLTGFCLLMYLLLAVVFPRPLQVCVQALEDQPLAALLAGILAILLIGPLMFLLVVSVVGIAVVPFLICGLLAAVVFGKTALYQMTGRHLGQQFGFKGLEHPLLALALGVVLFSLVYMIPVLGFLAWGLVVPVACGAVLLAMGRGFKRDSTPVRVPLSWPSTSPMVGLAAPAMVPLTSLPALEGAPAAAGAGVGAPEPVLPPLGAGPGYMPMPPVMPEFLALPRAGFWIRLCASVADLVVVFGAMAFLHLSRYSFLVWAAYHIAMWAWRGTTIGGALLGLKIVRLDGHPIDWPLAIVRCLSAFLSGLALFLGFFWAGWDKDQQSWHDKIAGTVIVKVPKGTPLI